LAHMSISTYFRPNIHQNGPEILGVKNTHSKFQQLKVSQSKTTLVTLNLVSCNFFDLLITLKI
jgi:hypothetical protein